MQRRTSGNRLRAWVGGDIITSIFADGTDGFYFDFSLLSSLWQDTAGTTPVTAAGQNIARADDQSGNANNATQATISAQPKYQTGGFALLDGLDDTLITPVTAATGLTMMFKGRLAASGANAFVFATSAGGARAYLGFDTSGQLFTNFGATAVTRAGNLATTLGVAAVTLSGGNATLYWQGDVAVGPSAVGAPNTTVPIAVGALTTGPGVYGSFFPGDQYRALTIKKALTAAEITAITNLWGTS